MKAHLYNLIAEKTKVTKTVADNDIIENYAAVDVTPRQPFSLSDPVFMLDVRGFTVLATGDFPPHFNYMGVEIPDKLNDLAPLRTVTKYYFVNDVIGVNSGLYEIRCHEDVLNTFSSQILVLDAIVARQENETDTNIPDPAMVYDDDEAFEVVDFTADTGHTNQANFDAWGKNAQEIGHLLHQEAHTGGVYVLTVFTRNPTTYEDAWNYDTASYSNHIPHRPDYLPLPAQTTAYILDRDHAQWLVSYLETSDFLDNIKLFFTNPADYIISLRLYPGGFYFPRADSLIEEYIKIFNITTTVKGYRVQDAPNLLYLGHVDIDETNGDYMDYPPYTQMSLYLPYIGFVDLDVYEVMRQTLSVRYALDIYTGDCTAYIIVGTSEATERVIMQSSGEVGQELQFGGGYNNAILKSLVGSAKGIIGGIATTVANPLAGAISIMGGSLTALQSASSVRVTRGGATSATLAEYSPQKPFLIIRRKKKHMPDNYEKYIGKICNKELSLSSLSGFTQIGDVHLSGFPTATSAELDEIERLLKSGVIF